MLKRILISIIIIIIIFSLNIYATEVNVTEEGNTHVDNTIETDNNQNTTEGDNKAENKEDTPNGNKEVQGNNQVEDKPQSSNNKNEEKNNNKQVTQTPNSTTVINESKSKENNLKQLSVDIDGMTPEFNKNTTEYYLITDLNTEKIKVTAIPVDEKATVTISGNTKLKEGANTISISVKAENGNMKMYYIYVNKVDNIAMANALLESLQVTNYNIYPSFKSTIYNYNLDIKDNTEKLEIIAKPENENATIVIEGAEELKQGENIVKVIVTAEDGATVRTYKINAYVEKQREKLKEENKTPAIVLLTIIGSCIIILVIFEYNKFKKNK